MPVTQLCKKAWVRFHVMQLLETIFIQLTMNMIWVTQNNVARTLNDHTLPTKVSLYDIRITPYIRSQVFHGQLSELVLWQNLSFAAEEEGLDGTADAFLFQLLQCRQLRRLWIFDKSLNPPIRKLVYRSPVSACLETIVLASIAGCRSSNVVGFCKAVCLTSQLKLLSIRAVKDEKELVLLGSLLLWTGSSVLKKLGLPSNSWELLTAMFHRVANERAAQDSQISEVVVVSRQAFNIGRLVAELLRCTHVHTVHKYKTAQTQYGLSIFEGDPEFNNYWTQIAELETNLK